MVSLEQILAEKRRRRENKINTFFPEKGTLNRHLYKKHMEFFKAGISERERLFIAANRVGKTIVGAYETALHLTGLYPEWWEGRQFKHQIDSWCAGNSSETTRDILQLELLGEINDIGTGMIPKSHILDYTKKRGVPDAIDTVFIKNIFSSEPSKLGFKSFDQGRSKFQGTAKHLIWLDEEVSMEVYLECLLRTMTTDGLTLLTFTPLSGLTELVQNFIGEDFTGESPKFYINATWNDAPHLSPEQVNSLMSGIPAYQLEARSKGIPSLGSGAIYPIEDSRLEVEDFAIPDHWPRIFGMDVGYNNTAAVWLAFDPQTEVKYVYTEYKTGLVDLPVHAVALKAKACDKIEGVGDYAGTDQSTGIKILDEYKKLDINVRPADKRNKEADLFSIYQSMIAGKLKFFKSCQGLFNEKRLYHRNERGQIVKTNDHLLDALQYAFKVPVNEWTLMVEEDTSVDQYHFSYSTRMY